MNDQGILWWAGQFLGVLAIVVSYGAMLLADDKKHIVGTAIGAVIDGFHWLFLSANTGAAIAFLIAIRMMVAHETKKDTAKSKMAVFIFSIIFSVLTAISYEDLFSLLPLLAAIMATYAYFFTSGAPLRWWLIAANLPWVFYSIHIVSIPGAMAAVLAMTLLGVAIFKIKREAA